MIFYKFILKSFLFFIFVNNLYVNNLSIGGGVYSCLKKQDQTFEIDLEYKFETQKILKPVIGFNITKKSTTYLYGGVSFDIFFFNHLLLAPGFAIGYYNKGKGKNLYFPIEFKSSIKLAYQFLPSKKMIGLSFYHLSHARIKSKNPGVESLILYYEFPI